MCSLQEDLRTPKTNMDDFARVCRRVLGYLPSVVSNRTSTNGYRILSSEIAGTRKYARPINESLFIESADPFDIHFSTFIDITNKIKNREVISPDERNIIDKVIYTIQQSIGIGMDFLCDPNSARKHVGNRFEELIHLTISLLDITNDKIVFKIPYSSQRGQKLYSCETDLILSPHDTIQSNTTDIDENEVVISLKTTSKDRMGKIFLDKLLMEKFADHSVKVVGIFLNDIQRKGPDKVNYTLVSGLFMVYTEFLTRLEGVYFVDPPPVTRRPPHNQHIDTFSKFLSEDIWNLIAP